MNLPKFLHRIINRITLNKDHHNPYSTHSGPLKLALEFLAKDPKQAPSILEVGVGNHSTKLILEALSEREDSEVISVENDPHWLKVVQDEVGSVAFRGSHRWEEISKRASWHSTIQRILEENKVRLAFIDSSPWDSRSIALMLTHRNCEIVIVHDVDYFPKTKLWGNELAPIAPNIRPGSTPPREELGRRDYSDLFSSWCEIFPNVFEGETGPPTLVGSNIINIQDVIDPNLLNGFTILNKTW